MRCLALAACLGVLLLPVQAWAMQFELLRVSGTEQIIGGLGPIVPGDADRLTKALAQATVPGPLLLGMALDSGGGNVLEAKKMVAIIKARRVPVAIPSNSKCASACFLMLAAAPLRLAATDALIGVHSASENGTETDVSLAVTTLMARDAADLGVPSGIIGKMVRTTSGRMEWLAPDDLATMRVVMYEGPLGPALRKAREDMARPAPPPPVPTSSPGSTVPAPAATADGRADRRAWDQWFNGLRGAYLEGAAFARLQTMQERSACFGASNEHRGDYTLGCLVAQGKLAAIQERIRTSPEYASGWNGDAVATTEPNTSGESVEGEYKGVYFCSNQVTYVTLRLFRRKDRAPRRALLLFGPSASGAATPQGSFITEGTLDLAGGAINLVPVAWATQPPGYAWFGLRGASEDGGRTFLGNVTNSEICTRFTLSRKT